KLVLKPGWGECAPGRAFWSGISALCMESSMCVEGPRQRTTYLSPPHPLARSEPEQADTVFCNVISPDYCESRDAAVGPVFVLNTMRPPGQTLRFFGSLTVGEERSLWTTNNIRKTSAKPRLPRMRKPLSRRSTLLFRHQRKAPR